MCNQIEHPSEYQAHEDSFHKAFQSGGYAV